MVPSSAAGKLATQHLLLNQSDLLVPKEVSFYMQNVTGFSGGHIFAKFEFVSSDQAFASVNSLLG